MQFNFIVLCAIIKIQEHQKGLELNGTQLLFCDDGVNLLSKNVNTTEENKSFNLLRPTGHVIHHQFNIQQLYALPTLFLYLSENKQRLVPLTA